MRVEDLYNKELIQNMKIAEIKVHTDDDGEVVNVQIKYVPDNKNFLTNSEKSLNLN